jgi:hypothetical protein
MTSTSAPRPLRLFSAAHRKKRTEETIMHNDFMKHDFKNYFAPDGRGDYKAVSRSECLSYDKRSFTGKYPQRWHWDAESSFVIRLERNDRGERIYNEARADRRRLQKTALEQSGCVCKECLDCKGWDVAVGSERKCDTCVKHVLFISLDEDTTAEDGNKAVCVELSADTDVHQEIKSSFLLETLHKELQGFTAIERDLWRHLVAGDSKKAIAAHFGWTLDKLSYRQLKLFSKIRSNSGLKSFFEND